MLNIGLDDSQNFVYESSHEWGHAIWPSPVLTPAKFAFASEGELIAESRSGLVTDAWMFREDSFDPIARIRRGRFYHADGQQPVEWLVSPHPAFPDEKTEKNGRIKKHLQTYYGNPIWHKFIKNQPERPVVLLGLKDRYTIWTILDVEAIHTGEDLVTLKARSSLGVLPEINETELPDEYRVQVIETMGGLVDEFRRSAPVSVIDRARDAASLLLLAYFKATSEDAKDLGVSIKRLEKQELVIAASAAKIIARLHARAKPVEKAKRKLRPVREQDADLAVQCVGTILCEFDWADWA